MLSFFKIALAAGLACAASCAKTTDSPGLGTNTNWLQTCEEQDDCGDGASCLCGVCTLACEETAECGEVHAETRCVPLDDAACGAGSAGGSACLQGCESNEDCSTLADGRCAGGVCVPRAPTPMSDSGVENPDPFALERAGSTIQLTAAYLECSEHGDCRLVQTSCNGCCAQAAIAADLFDTYASNMTLACADYEGAVCDCSFEDLVARCVADRCAAVARDSIECFAPEVDDYPYDPDDVGCPCAGFEDKSICTGPAALICDRTDEGHYAWIAVEDGPCGEPTPDPTCADGTIRATASACLEDFTTCYRLESGEYCGVTVTVDP